MKNIFSNKIFSGFNINLTTGSIGFALLVAIVFVIFSSYLLNRYSANDRQYLSYTGELRILSQRIAKNALEAAGGTQEAFTALRQTRNEFNTRWNFLKQGNPDINLPAITSEGLSGVSEAVDELDGVWSRVKVNADQIIANQESVLSLHKITRELADVIPDIQEEYDDIVEILLEVSAPSDQIVMAQRQSLLAEKIIRSANKVLAGGADAVDSSKQFDENTRLFNRVLNAMVDGNVTMRISKVTDIDALSRLEEAKEAFEIIQANVGEIVETSPQLFSVRSSADTIFVDSQALLDKSSNLFTTIEGLSEKRWLNVPILFVVGTLAVFLFIVLVLVIIAETRKNLAETEATNQRNQAAILRLLDELADLADGNLNVQATVTEDFTGAIADSINFSIDQMRILVSQINETSVQVSSAAQETQATAMHLAEASEHQAQEIAGASAAVNEMAVSIDQVSYNAAESSAVAERAVAIANKGAEVVQNTINGMDNIRSQIQETSKRIKRLGESTQEIGDIVSLINDIADQTNILALNAAIQAAMAGDAGRGFAVVADEVQRLAERASAATKQIEALVKTIQTDTNEAVISMEQTTAEVVQGARLAQDAGVALEEIENVSTTLAELIQNISNAARQQASSAGHISNTMNVIQEITSQTSAGTNATARSISNLAELANQMRRSVAGFKLPDSHITLDA